MVDLEWLPGIDYWGARNIDNAVDASAAGGALLGFTAASLLGTPITVTAGIIRHHAGYPWGYTAIVVLKLAGVYLALLAIAHWQTIDQN